MATTRKRIRKNPLPIGGAVIANPAVEVVDEGNPQLTIKVQKGMRVTRSKRNPYEIKVTQVKYPPASRPRARSRLAAAAAARAYKPPRKTSARRAPARKRGTTQRRRSRLPARAKFPPFTPPSAQARANPSFLEGVREGALGPDMLKITAALLVVGFGVPALRQLLLKLVKKEDVGADGRVTGFSHAIQTALAAGVFGAAEMKLQDAGVKRATQALALAVALARPANQLVTKFRPDSSLKFLGEAPDLTRPLVLDFDVIPPGASLSSGLGQEVDDLDSDPVLDAILQRRAQGAAPAIPAQAQGPQPAAPPVPPQSEPVPAGPTAVEDPQVSQPGEPLVGDPQPPDPSGPLLGEPLPPEGEGDELLEKMGYLPFGSLIGAEEKALN